LLKVNNGERNYWFSTCSSFHKRDMIFDIDKCLDMANRCLNTIILSTVYINMFDL